MRGCRPSPPRLARLLVRARSRHLPGGEVEADLQELFESRTAERGVRHARRRYWRDALSLWIYRPPGGVREPARMRRLPDPGSVGQDMIFAARLFRRTPGVVALTVTGLALAVGVATAVFSLLNAALLRPIGVADPEATVAVWRTHATGVSTAWPYAEFVQLRDAARYTRLEAYIAEGGPLATGSADDDAGSVQVNLVGGSYFETFGGRAALGRTLVPLDDSAGLPLVAVVNHTFWRNRLGADPAVVGRTVYFFGVPATIVGVIDRRFTGPTGAPPSFWLPLVPAQSVWSHHGPFHPGSAAPVSVRARIAPGVSRAQAEAELSALAVSAGVPAANSEWQIASGASLVPAGGREGPRTAVIVAVVMTALSLVLLLACVNVANVLLASAATRQREIGVRLALGAGRGRIVRQLLTESLMLGALGGALGLLAVVWLVPALAIVVEVPPTADVAPDFRVYGFTIGVSLLAGLAAGLAPCRYGTRGDVLLSLAVNGPQTADRSRGRFLRSGFVGAQAAASIALLVLAALLTRAVVHVSHVDVGFDAERLIGVTPGFAREKYDAVRARQYWEVALERAKSLPDVESAALVEHLPLGDSRHSSFQQRDGRRIVLNHNRTSADFFQAAGMPLLSGRAYTPDEVRNGAPVAVISASLAREFWGGEDPVGATLERVSRDLSGVLIVGVTRDAMTGRLTDTYVPTVYRPLSANPAGARLLVRARGDVTSALKPLREAVHAIDPSLTVTVWPVRDGLSRQLTEARALATIAGLVGGLALALAVIGIFGVTTFVLAQRMREIGVRLALGATARDVMHLLLRDSLRPVAIGLAAGLLAALAGSRVLSGILYGVSAHDPLAVGAAVLVLVSAAGLAVVLPARRASRADPVAILHEG